MPAWGTERVAYDMFGMNANLKGFGTIGDITTQTPAMSIPAAGPGRAPGRAAPAPTVVPIGTNKPAGRGAPSSGGRKPVAGGPSHGWGGRADGAAATNGGDKPKQQRQKRGPRARNPKGAPPGGGGAGGSTA